MNKCRLFKTSQSRLELLQKRRIQNALKTNIEATINQTFSRGISPEPTLREGHTPSRAFPLPLDHFQRRGDGPELGLIQFLIWRFLIRNMNEINQPKKR